MLAKFLDFVVWGHEHECLVDPQVLSQPHVNSSRLLVQTSDSSVNDLNAAVLARRRVFLFLFCFVLFYFFGFF